MPYRTMTLEEVAQYLHLGRRYVEVLVKRNEIPHDLQGERVVFMKRQVDAWASQRILGLSDSTLARYHKESSAKHHDLSPGHALMPELLDAGRVLAAMHSRTKASVLGDLVTLADKAELVSDRAELLASLEEREKLCSTALPGGVALLHPRNHLPYMFMDSFIALGRLISPVHAGAPDGDPTDLFFLICCQEDRIHLHILARLCTMIRNTAMLGEIRQAGDVREILAAIVTAEEEVIRRL